VGASERGAILETPDGTSSENPGFSRDMLDTEASDQGRYNYVFGALTLTTSAHDGVSSAL
jgi:hypothetical protein